MILALIASSILDHNRRVFDTLLRVARPALAGRTAAESKALLSEVVRAFVSSLSPSRDPELRVAQFALLDSFLLGGAEDDPRISRACRRLPAREECIGVRRAGPRR